MSWRSRQRRKALLRWSLGLFILGALLIVGMIKGLPILAGHFTKTTLADLGFSRRDLEITAISPWFARAESIALVRDNLKIKADRITTDFVPWDAIKGHVESIVVEGLEITLTLPGHAGESAPETASATGWTMPVLPELILPSERITLIGGALIIKRGSNTLRIPLEGSITPEKDGLLALINGQSTSMEHAVKIALSHHETSGVQASIRLEDTATALALAHEITPPWPADLEVTMDPLNLDVLAEAAQGEAPAISAMVDTSGMQICSGDTQIDLGHTAAALSWQPQALPTFSLATEIAVKLGDLRIGPSPINLLFKAATASVQIAKAPFQYGNEASGVVDLRLQLTPLEAMEKADVSLDASVNNLSALGHNFSPLNFKARGHLSDFTVEAENVASSAFATARMSELNAHITGLPEHLQVEATALALIRLNPALPAEFPLNAWVAADLPKDAPPRARFTLGNRDDGINLELNGNTFLGTGGFSLEGTLENNSAGVSADWVFPTLSIKAAQGTLVCDQVSGSMRSNVAPVATWQKLSDITDATPTSIIGILPELLKSFHADGNSLVWNDEITLNGWSLQASAQSATRSQPATAGGLLIVDSARWKQHTLTHMQTDLTYDGVSMRAQANGLYGDYSIPWAADISADSAGRGRFTFASSPFSLQKGLLFVGLIPALKDLELSGRYQINAEGTFQGSTYAAQAGLMAENATLRFASKEITVEGLNTDIALESVDPLRTKGTRTITFSSISTGKLDITDGVIEFHIDDNETVVISKMEYGLLGGRIMAAPFTVNPTKPAFTLALACIGLDLVEATTLFPQLQVEAAGLLDGVVSFRIEKGQITPLPGYLELRKGMQGKIRYRNDGWLTSGLDIKSLNFQINRSVETAFNNFDVDSLRIDIKETIGRDVGVTIVSSGSGYGETLKAKVPIGSLTVNTEIPIQDLMELPLLKIFSMIDMEKKN